MVERVTCFPYRPIRGAGLGVLRRYHLSFAYSRNTPEPWRASHLPKLLLDSRARPARLSARLLQRARFVTGPLSPHGTPVVLAAAGAGHDEKRSERASC